MSYPARRLFAVLIAFVGLAASCSKPKTEIVTLPSPSPSPSTGATAPPASGYACGLLTGDEVRAVQGEAFKDAKPSEKSGAGLLVSQCYFELPVAVNSIVLTVTRKAEGGRDPIDNWRDIFYREKESRKKEEGEEKKPERIDGVGDEAFWEGTRVGGVLYVLKGNSYIRISVGGAGDQAQKIEKSKALAESVLKRL
jgi:hypothetical protein